MPNQELACLPIKPIDESFAFLQETLKQKTWAIPCLTQLYNHNSREARDSVKVAFIALAIGQKLSLGYTDLIDLFCACLVHDFGKIFIDNAILDKNVPLSDAEKDLIRTHTTTGYKVINRLDSRVATIIVGHHEWQIDPPPYPRNGNTNGCHNDERRKPHNVINLLSKILAMADQIDARMSHRPGNRDPANVSQAFEQIPLRLRQDFFDSQITQELLLIGINRRNDFNLSSLS